MNGARMREIIYLFNVFAAMSGITLCVLYTFLLDSLYSDITFQKHKTLKVHMTDTKHWIKPLRAAGVLGIGKVGQVFFMFIALALTARTLGVEAFGVLTLIHSLIIAIAKIARFQTWQALVHYGTKALDDDDTPRLLRIIRFSIVIDCFTALIGVLLLWLISVYALEWVGLSEHYADYVLFYGSAVIFMVLNGAPNGILQLYDRFDRIAWHTALGPFIRCVGCIYLYFSGGELIDFLIVWYLAEVVSAGILIGFGYLVLHQNNMVKALLRSKEKLLNPEVGGWRYIGGTQAASTLDLSGTHLPVLMVGGVLGAEAAGLYRVAQEFSSVLLKPGAKIFGHAIYPELARLFVQDNFALRRQMMIKTALIAGTAAFVIFLLFVLFGQTLITLSAGAEYSGAYHTLLWLSFAGVVSLFGFALEPLLISAGLVKETVYSRLIATLIFFPWLIFLLHTIGIAGAGIAACIYTCIMIGLMLYAARSLLVRTDEH